MIIIQEPTTQQPTPCVATIGFFDGVHLGHRFLIEQVKQLARKQALPSLLITFVQHPRKVMDQAYQPQLLTTPEEKAELLSSTGADCCVMLDFTTELSKLSARDFMERILKQKLGVRTLVIGYDHRFGRNRTEGFEEYCRYGTEIGIDVVRAQACLMDGMNVSSSVVRTLLEEGAVARATSFLGYNYFLDGTVEDGYKVGRMIGFPTANLHVENVDKLVPSFGVYAVWVEVSGKRYMGMLNIGNRPTMNNGTHRTIEVNILDFNSDIYHQRMRLLFVSMIRPEIKFDRLEELVVEIHRDEERVRKLLTPRIKETRKA